MTDEATTRRTRFDCGLVRVCFEAHYGLLFKGAFRVLRIAPPRSPSSTMSGLAATTTGKGDLHPPAATANLRLSQQLLQIFCKAHHDDDCGPGHSDKEEWHDDPCNEMNHEIHTYLLYLPD